MKTIKRGISFALAFVLAAAMLPAMPRASAAASYSVDAAISYAKTHWNDGQGLCAEFVSRCVRAGGLDMKVITTTRSCLKAASSASGLPIKELKLNSAGYATKADNGSILAAGDVVAQYCNTHEVYPHILLCGGYDSKGRATFYAHNGPANNELVQLSVNTAYDHTLACDIRAHVVHLSSLDNGLFTSSDSSSDSSSSAPSVTFAAATDASYKSKESVSNTNAVVVSKVVKPAGVSVSKMGVILYNGTSSNASVLKKYSESVSNVSNSTTTYHSWFDINKELGVTLTPGTDYSYQFFGVFNGYEVTGSRRTLRTTGTAPVTSYQVIYHQSDWAQIATSCEVGKPIGTIIASALDKEGYTFVGWFTSPTGGTQVTEDTIFNVSSDLHLYPQYVKDETPVVTEPVEEPVEEEPETYTILFTDPRTMQTYGTYTVQNGDKYPLPSKTPTRTGYAFDGWYTSSSGGTQITTSTTVNLTSDRTFYPHWRAVPTVLPVDITLQIGSPYMYVDGSRKTIDEQGTRPITKDGRTLLPVRAVVEAMGGTVGWEPLGQVVSLKLDGKTLYLQIGHRMAWDNSGEYHYMDVAPITQNGRTLLPIRFVVEYFGGTVGWEASTQTVSIEY